MQGEAAARSQAGIGRTADDWMLLGNAGDGDQTGEPLQYPEVCRAETSRLTASKDIGTCNFMLTVSGTTMACPNLVWLGYLLCKPNPPGHSMAGPALESVAHQGTGISYQTNLLVTCSGRARARCSRFALRRTRQRLRYPLAVPRTMSPCQGARATTRTSQESCFGTETAGQTRKPASSLSPSP